MPPPLSIHLADGTPALIRPITPEDGPALTRGLGRLSPEGHAYRFLHYRSRFTPAELHYLTRCDFANHIALLLTLTDSAGREIDQVGVARSIRTKGDPQLAEVAIVLVDEYQHRGGGLALLRALALLAWESGIRRWLALSLSDNHAVARLFARIGTEISRRAAGHGAIETIHALRPPS